MSSSGFFESEPGSSQAVVRPREHRLGGALPNKRPDSLSKKLEFAKPIPAQGASLAFRPRGRGVVSPSPLDCS